MAYTVESRSENAPNALRDALAKAEYLVVSINAENVEPFLTLLDDIEASLDTLAAQENLDIRPERARWESLLRRISSQPGPIASAAAKAGGFSKLRAQHPPADSFWWHLDGEVNRRRWHVLRRTLVTLVLIVVVVGGGIWLIDTLFPPDPNTLLMVEAQSQIDEYVFQQDWEGAIEVVAEARTQLPDEPELMIWEGVLAERLGDTERATTVLAEAQAVMTDEPELFWITAGNYRVMVGDLDGAEQAAEQALALNPDSATGYFLLANVAESRGERIKAIDLLETVFLLAEEDSPQLAVIAKVRMGQLMQQFDPFETATPTTAQESDQVATPTVEP